MKKLLFFVFSILAFMGCSNDYEDPINKVVSFSVSDITSNSATISGGLILPSEELPSAEVILYYAPSESFDVTSAESISVTEFAAAKFKVTLTELTPETKYALCLEVRTKAQIVVGKVNEFTTLDGPPFTFLTPAANCYIISQEGDYAFNTVKGNSGGQLKFVASAEVLWESFGTDVTPSVGDLVKNVSYNDGEITFTATDKKGNAVIAAKDAKGSILWSWHIWLTDQPTEQEYFYDAGIMMDRNLGAISANPGDIGALGLFYQWGRKDPFLGSLSNSYNFMAESTITWPAAVLSEPETGTTTFASANPTTFIIGNRNYDWHYKGDDTLWSSYKSIYDPCPAGWQVPIGGPGCVWATALGGSMSAKEVIIDGVNKGVNFKDIFGASDIWYPLAGALSYKAYHLKDEAIIDVGSSAHYWTTTAQKGQAETMRIYYDKDAERELLNLANVNYRTEGLSVRCVKQQY